MLQTTDGRKFVYAIYSADGCECENLEAVFESEDGARTFFEKIKVDPYLYGKPEFASIRMIELNKRMDPLADLALAATESTPTV